MNIYDSVNSQWSDSGNLDTASSQDILKAMEAGLQTGEQYWNEANNGGGLKVESLDAVLKVLTNRLNQLVYYLEMPKEKVGNTVHQYNQLYKYGEDVSIFNQEGETPQETDSQYRRMPVTLKFTGVAGQVTLASTMVKLAGGINMYTKEVQNKTILLQTLLDQNIVSADSSIVAEEFDGLFRQHLIGINQVYTSDITGLSAEAMLDAYFADPCVINADGEALSDSFVEDASQAVVNDRNGEIDRIVTNPAVVNQYVKTFHESKRVVVGYPGGVTGATMGQSVNKIQTQFGSIDVKNDKFFDRRMPKKYNASAMSVKAPQAPVADITAPVAVATDTKTMFTNHAGTYFYAVASVNHYGESGLTVLNTTAQAVTTTQAVNLKFTAATGDASPATGFVIYRTMANVANYQTADFYPIFKVSTAQLTAGYDGGSAGVVRDRNRFVAGTKSAIIYYNSDDINNYVQLNDVMKLDFAITSPAKRFAILNYGSPVWYQPGKVARIVNLKV